MAQDFTDVLNAARMSWKPSSLELLSTLLIAPDADMTLWQNGSSLAIKGVVNMEVLGCMLSSSGDPLVPVRH
eukprot:3525226-Karenia_brevis.AAC.1